MIKLRWRPDKPDWFVFPENLSESAAKPFRVSRFDLIDPDLFDIAAMDHGAWPKAPRNDWRRIVLEAIRTADYAQSKIGLVGSRAELACIIMQILDGKLHLDEGLELLEQAAG